MQEAYNQRRSLGDQLNRQIMRDLRLYMLVGGMPQAVNTYLATKNLSEVDQTKREILELYNDDFRKIDSSGRIARLFRAIPSELAKNASRYQVTSVLGNNVNRVAIDEALADLEDSLCVTCAYHAYAPSAGFALHKDIDRYKMFLADTGLFITLAFWDKSATDNIIYQKLLSDKLNADLGYVYENVVAQMLTAAGHELYYHTWPTPSGKHNYEIDFLIMRGSKVCPIEVKSSGYKAHASLDAFAQKYSSQIAQSYLLYTKDLRRIGGVDYVPIYMTMML